MGTQACGSKLKTVARAAYRGFKIVVFPTSLILLANIGVVELHPT
jgi:hypothetical protein